MPGMLLKESSIIKPNNYQLEDENNAPMPSL